MKRPMNIPDQWILTQITGDQVVNITLFPVEDHKFESSCRLLASSTSASLAMHRDQRFLCELDTTRVAQTEKGSLLGRIHPETPTNLSKSQGSRKNSGLCNPMRTGDWVLNSYALPMWLDILDIQYTGAPHKPASIQTYASYVVCGWFGIRVSSPPHPSLITKDQSTWWRAPGIRLRRSTSRKISWLREVNAQGFPRRGYLRCTFIWEHFERYP